MAVLRFNKSLKIDLNLVALVLTSIFLIITMSLAAAVASRCPSKVSLRNALSSTCVQQTNADAKDKCISKWCNDASHWSNQCPGKFKELRERGFDPEYNRNYLDKKFPSDLSSVSLGFAAFSMLCFCILIQGLAHIADFVQPGSSGLRLTDKQKMFLQIWLGVSWLVLILTWVLVLAGSVQAQKEWGLYNSPCGVFISSAVFAALSLLMFAVYNTLALRKGPHLDAGSEPLTPVSGAGQKMKNDPGWRMGGAHDSNHVYSEEQLLESQGAPYFASPTAAGQTPTSATGGTVHVHVAPSYYNAPMYQAPDGGYVSAPGGHPTFNVESGDISAMGPLKQYGTEPITMTGPMERLRPGGGSRDALSTEVFASARPPPPPPADSGSARAPPPPHLGFGSPPQAPPIIKAGQLANMSLEELQDATNNFAEENLLGQGGFGCVYRGQLSDGSLIAVKRLHPSVATGSKGSQGAREFQAEVEIISRVHHKNLVKLLGFCVTPEEQLLAYEFLPQGSLYEHLHRNTTDLNWETRQKIAVGSARGLAYLHEDCAPKVIHRDIKASNILLDANFNAQVADFGLARLIKEENTHITTRVMGTFGYLAPDYAFSGQLNEKSDVYSFGVVLLELLTGKKPVDPSAPPGQQSLVQWAWQLEQDSETDESIIVDPLLDGKYNAAEVSRMWSTAMKCVIHMPQKRPSMAKVLQLLLGDNKGDEEESVKPPKNSSAEKYRSIEEAKLTAIHEDHSGGQQSVSSMSSMFAGILSDAKDDHDSSIEAEVKEMDRPVNASKEMEGSPDKEDRNKAQGMPENEDVPEQAKGMAKSSSNQWVPFVSSALGSSPQRGPSNREEKQFYGSSPQRVASGREEKFYGSSPQRVASGREEKFYGSSPQRVASGREEKFYGSSPQRVASGRKEKFYGSSPQRVASGRDGSGEEDYDSATGEGLEEKASPRTPRTPRNKDRDNDTEVSAPHSVILPERFLEAR